MSKIKTREKVKDIKLLDKSAVAAQRMKNAFVRSKDRAANLADDGQITPSEYAEDKVQYAAEDISRDAAHAAGSGMKTAGRKGKEAFQRQKAKTAEKSAFQGEQPSGTVLRPYQRQQNPGSSRSISSPVEQGRQLAKKQAANRVNTTRRMENAAHAVKEPVRTIKQTARSTGKASVKTAGKTVKATQRTVKTAEQTSKAAIKTAKATARAAQKAAQASAKAARATAQAARAAAKATVAAAKVAAKAVISAVKAIIAATKALISAIAAGGWVAVLAIVIICLIGLIVGSCFGIFFSGEDSGTGQTMQTAVQEINREYEEKLAEIKAANPHDTLEMSGSRAVWPEVLAVYAVKTTTDPDNAQEVATMDEPKKALLKEIFWAMNQVDHRTETHTTTETVESDDGDGNIVTEEIEVTKTTLTITVSHKTADEMADAYHFTADQREQLAELLAEENRSLWSAVLYGIGTGDGEIVTVALSQIGNVGGEPYWSWYGFGSRVEWCACFVSWCANECGYIDTGVIPKFAGCVTGSQWFKDRGLWQGNSYEPRPSDIIFFDWDNKGGSGPQDGESDHVGIVEKVENGTVYTVEGNSGDSCRENSYSVGYYEIYGYGTPAY